MKGKILWLSLFLLLVNSFVPNVMVSVPGQESSTQAKAKISGRVLTASGKPLPGATVNIGGAGGDKAFAKTDQTGHYTLEVEPGTYSVWAEHNGYVTVWYKLEGATGKHTPLTLEAGQSVSNVDFRLKKGGVITGRILDEYGEPLIGQRVMVIPKDKEENRPTMSSWIPMMTDDRGIYRIYGLSAGSYYVGVQREEQKIVRLGAGLARIPEQAQTTYYPGVSLLSEATEVLVTEGAETTGIDFKLKPTRAEGLRIFGRVTNQSGQPVDGAMVWIMPSERSGPIMPNQVFCDGNGQYEIKGLQPGKYVVQAVNTRMFTQQEEGTVAPLAKEVTLDKESLELNFQFERAAVVSGRIVLEGNRVPQGVTEFYITLRPFGDTRVFGSFRPGIPDKGGNFTIKSVPSGQYRIEAYRRESPYYVKLVLVGDVDVHQTGLVVEAGNDVSDVLIMLSEAGATLKGRVLAQKGPLPGASVFLTAVEALTLQHPELAFTTSAVSDQRGQFQIKAIRPGRYFVFTLNESPPWKGTDGMAEFLRNHREQIQVIELKDGETKELDLKPLLIKTP
ncbi:MAG: carboxypeptidase-like regulatory domain-containing protein [Acidobacteriota bacterium]|nr:carboxypeptidase-like regulatory domain-containing protein [Blastocatellia bacterium]MDW8239668.1 carboxypeptidase-like regulatory domain-containing protein [Acidobacteriota bacterium]